MSFLSSSFLFSFGYLRAAHAVDHMFSLHILTICYLVISRIGFKGKIWVLIAPFPCHCSLVTFEHVEINKTL